MPTASTAGAPDSTDVDAAIAAADAQGAEALAQAKRDMAARTGAALGNHAKNVAIDTLKMRIRDYLKPHLPYFLQPLLPGVRGSVSERAGRQFSRWVSRMFWGAVLSVICGVIFVAVFVGIFAFAIGMVYLNMPG
jgi:hypothetical protein